MEVVDEERGERIYKMKRKMHEWKAIQNGRQLLIELVEEAVDESNASLWRDIVEGCLVVRSLEGLYED